MSESGTPIAETLLAFVDVETTGLDPQTGDRICEIAILRCLGPDVVGSYQQLVNPQRPMNPGAFAVHGIGDDLLRDAPPFGEISADVLDMVQGAILVAHNAPFDVGFIVSEFRHAHIQAPTWTALDTLRLARRVYRVRSYALGNLATSLGIDTSHRAHRAMADVLTTRSLFWQIIDDLWDHDVRLVEELLQLQGGPDLRARPSRVELPPAIAQALRDGRMLHLTYRAAGGETTERFVKPLSIFTSGPEPRLLAFCYLRNERRSFRLDRILEADVVLDMDPNDD